MTTTPSLIAGQKIRDRKTGQILTVSSYSPKMHPPIVTEESSQLFDLKDIELVHPTNEPQPATAEGEAHDPPTCTEDNGGQCQDCIEKLTAQLATPHTAELPRLDFHIAEDLIQPPKPRTSACLLIEEDSGHVVAEFANSPGGIAKCQQIVTEHNAHAALVKALAMVYPLACQQWAGTTDGAPRLEQIRAALAGK